MSIYISMFVEGALSFFSPCIIPVLPVYFGYLASGSKKVDADGNVYYDRLKVFITTCFFVLGISFAILLLGISVSVFNDFFSDYRLILSYVGSFVLIIFGLYQLNIINIPFLLKERKLNIKLDLNKMNFLTAYLFGFLFSFCWTPCIGPYLTSAIVLAGTSGSIISGIIHILVYILGFIIPFLLVGLFTEEILNLINNKKNILKYTTVIGGIIILLMGFYMFYNTSKEVVSMQKQIVNTQTSTDNSNMSDMERFGFTLKTNKGNTVTLSDIDEDHVVLTFFRTWCTYCKQEINDLTLLAKEYPDIKFYLITSPNMNDELDEAGIDAFMKENNWDIEVIYDENNMVHNMYGISGFPSTFFFDDDQSIYGYVPGYVSYDQIQNILLDLQN